MKILYLLLLSCLFHGRLHQLYVFQRSAQHEPLISTDTYSPETPGELTNDGYDQSKGVGELLKEKLVEAGYTKEYNGSLFGYYSTFLTRAKMTQFALARGIYGKNGPKDGDEPIFLGQAQPIPSRSTLPENEYTLLSGLRCDDARRSVEEVQNSTGVSQLNTANKDLIDLLMKHAKCEKSPACILNSIDTLEYQVKHDKQRPADLSDENITKLVDYAKQYRILTYPVNESQYCNSVLGVLMHTIGETTDSLLNDTTFVPQINIYTGHRSTLASLYGCLSGANLSTVEDPLPSPSAILYLKLDISDEALANAVSKEDLYSGINVSLYRDFKIDDGGSLNPKPVEIDHCPGTCTYKTFHEHYSYLLNATLDTWYHNFCGMHEEAKVKLNSVHTYYTVQFWVSVAVIIIGFIFFIISLIIRLRRRSN